VASLLALCIFVSVRVVQCAALQRVVWYRVMVDVCANVLGACSVLFASVPAERVIVCSTGEGRSRSPAESRAAPFPVTVQKTNGMGWPEAKVAQDRQRCQG
jgi:hypothetical protein